MKFLSPAFTLAAIPLLCFAPALPAQAPEWAAKVDALVAERLARPDAVGFSVGIAQQGKMLLAKGYGLAEVEFQAPANSSTLFRIGSISKQFTAALVMRLVEQKQLALADGLEKYVPDFPLQGKTVTIHQLLNHSSGIPSYTDVGEEWEKLNPLELSHSALLAVVAGKPFDFEPGADWRYNNTGYYLLGMVLEKVHGKPYSQVVKEEVAVPLGFSNTRYDSNRDLIGNRAQGYTMHDGARVNDAPLGMSQPGAAGALLSTGEDLVRWSMALAGGKFVTAETYAQMTTPLVLASGRDTHYGFGLMRGEIAGVASIHHGGGINGFNSMLLTLPKADLHVAVISNSERASSERLAKAIVQAVLVIEPAVAKDLPVPAAVGEGCVGEFAFADIGMVLKVTQNGDKLRGQGEGQQAFDLLWQGEGLFRASFDHDVTFEFDTDRKQVTLHQGGGVFQGKRK